MMIPKTAIISLFAIYLVQSGLNCAKKEIPFFDGELAYDYLKAQTEFGPRNPGSEGARLCRDYLIAELAGSADQVTRQPFAFTDTKTDTSFELTNIIASFNLDPQDGRRILLMAHWDTRPRADQESDIEKRKLPISGANDGASGVAVLLQVAKVLREYPPPLGVDIVFFDGEDYGEEGDLDYYCLGSKHFAENIGDYRPLYGVLLDIVGGRNSTFPMEGNSLRYAEDITRKIWDIAEEYNIDVLEKRMGPTVYDDHLIINQAGIPSVDIIDMDYPYWHTLEDTADKCDPEILAQIGTLILALIYE
ncbi:M28 family peptidase [candidate division KSB1 bacterium]